jgi:large subunit ribosomal protein L24
MVNRFRVVKIRKGDKVRVLCGDSKGTEGTVLCIDRKTNRAIVSGVNMVARHTKASAKSEGGIMRKESTIHLSNIVLVDPVSGEAGRVGFRFLEDGAKARCFAKSGNLLSKS